MTFDKLNINWKTNVIVYVTVGVLFHKAKLCGILINLCKTLIKPSDQNAKTNKRACIFVINNSLWAQ